MRMLTTVIINANLFASHVFLNFAYVLCLQLVSEDQQRDVEEHCINKASSLVGGS